MSSWSSWKNHVPTFPVRLQAAGKQWTGQWQREGKDLVLASAYGSRRAPIGRRKPERLAEQLMREILLECAERGRMCPPIAA